MSERPQGEHPFPPQYMNPRPWLRSVLIALWVVTGLLLAVFVVLVVTGR